jgi:hypothetical protein
VLASQAALAEKAATEAQEKIDSQALPIRTYLDQTVVPILLQGLSDLVKARYQPRTTALSTATSTLIVLWRMVFGFENNTTHPVRLAGTQILW